MRIESERVEGQRTHNIEEARGCEGQDPYPCGHLSHADDLGVPPCSIGHHAPDVLHSQRVLHEGGEEGHPCHDCIDDKGVEGLEVDFS